MASRNSVKDYIPNSYYHIYNRGVEQRKIFMDEQDYSVFLSYLQTYLSPVDIDNLEEVLSSPNSTPKEKDKALKLLKLKNYSEDLDLVCYALMPNHFHLLIQQREVVINSFANSLGTRYAMYFNRKYKRKGVLFQDVYKAVLVQSEEQLLHLSRYIHNNPIKASSLSLPSSLPEYLGERKTNWIKTNHILDYFSLSKQKFTYRNFMGMSIDPEYLTDIAIDINGEL
ncbi:transposase [Candidatus Amesbacteria bacterium]|nr:transposase [Candidatus Amesbacteria bacterium]